MTFRAFFLPKRGNTATEYEDAFAGSAEQGRFAIADGAAESSFAAEWARILVEEFVRSPAGPLAEWPARLPPLRQQWLAGVSGLPLPWYAEEKVEQGAFATFLGLVVQPANWQAIAVGDSCLFQVREGGLLRCFPLTRSEEFGNAPWLVGSQPPPLALLPGKESLTEGDCRPGDRFWLMTDALAQWFLQQVETGGRPWEALEPLLDQSLPGDNFAGWIEDLRNQKALRNDDVTLLGVVG